MLYDLLFSLYNMINLVSHSENVEKFFEFSIHNVSIVEWKRILAKKCPMNVSYFRIVLTKPGNTV